MVVMILSKLSWCAWVAWMTAYVWAYVCRPAWRRQLEREARETRVAAQLMIDRGPGDD